MTTNSSKTVTLLKRVLQSSAFRTAKSKAADYLRDPDKARKLINDAIKQANGKKGTPLGETRAYLAALIRLTQAYRRAQYRQVPWETIVLVGAGLVYFVSPIDFLPDFLVGLGLLDDVAVISYVVASIKQELDRFLAWEAAQPDEIDGEAQEIEITLGVEEE